MLITNKFEYFKLTRNDTKNGRWYICPDGTSVASVTTILEATKPGENKIALQNWRNKVGEKQAKEITTQAANRGTRLHTFIEN